MTRLFLALSLPEAWKEEFEGRCRGLRGARWTRDRQFHLTLRFLGEASEERQRQLILEAARVRASPFALQATGFGAFPLRGRPRVVWAAVQKVPALLDLHRAVEEAARRAGFAAETRAFHPHITLGRLRDVAAQDVRRWIEGQAPLDLPPAPVTSFDLYSSRLRPEGALHRLERSFPLL